MKKISLMHNFVQVLFDRIWFERVWWPVCQIRLDPRSAFRVVGDFMDLLDAVLSIPQPRIDRLISASNTLKDRLPVVDPRFAVAVVGKIISLSPCVGNVSLIMSRFLQAAVTFRDAWDTPLDPESPLDRNA